MQEVGNIPERDMYNTFNMGIGMTVVVDKDYANQAVELMKSYDIPAYCIGEVVKGDEGIILL